jgi:hypothetical protein
MSVSNPIGMSHSEMSLQTLSFQSRISHFETHFKLSPGFSTSKILLETHTFISRKCRSSDCHVQSWSTVSSNALSFSGNLPTDHEFSSTQTAIPSDIPVSSSHLGNSLLLSSCLLQLSDIATGPEGDSRQSFRKLGLVTGLGGGISFVAILSLVTTFLVCHHRDRESPSGHELPYDQRPATEENDDESAEEDDDAIFDEADEESGNVTFSDCAFVGDGWQRDGSHDMHECWVDFRSDESVVLYSPLQNQNEMSTANDVRHVKRSNMDGH